MIMPTITPIFAGLFALIQIPMTIMVGYYRLKTNIRFLDGGDETMMRRMRAHANFTETVPITLIAMAAAEIGGAPPWVLYGGAFLLLAGRLLHYSTILRQGWGNGRAAGMMLTFIPMAVFGVWALLPIFRLG
jgi:uncharacterized membrane protein YecN with MAPEG domain